MLSSIRLLANHLQMMNPLPGRRLEGMLEITTAARLLLLMWVDIPKIFGIFAREKQGSLK